MSSGPGGSSSESPSCPIDVPEAPQISKPIPAKTIEGETLLEKTISCVSCRKRKLRCDRVKPRCGTCIRLQHECDFPERKRNLGSKRRNMKELEARLAQVETKLVSEVEAHKLQKNKQRISTTNMDETQDDDPDISNVTMDSSFGNEQFDLRFIPTPPSNVEGVPMSQELISMGIEEPLPPIHIIGELEKLYFETSHVEIPMIHKYRYYASLDRAPHMRPPICLRYAIWMTGSSVSEAYHKYEDVLYQRTRKYAEAAEMKGFGETFVTVYHAQTWGLISQYEAKRIYFSRSWMSSGRMMRLSSMLGLHRLDGDKSDVKQILSPPRDWIEKEERRRTFWAAFYVDRWASSGTGWPMGIEENEILTNLPASEESFQHGVEEKTVPLAEALTPGGAPNISSFAGVMISATLLGHNFQHLHRTAPSERPDDYAGGDFWKRHRKMDNVLSNTFMFLPDHLRIPNALWDMNVVFMHMNIHASIISLHQAAILTAERHGISPNVIKQCRDRSLMSAQTITSIMRSCSHVETSKMNLWTGHFLYVASGVCLQNAISESPSPESEPNLEFILAAMGALGQKHPVTRHFLAQLELDIEASTLGKFAKQSIYFACPPIMESAPNTPLDLDMMQPKLQKRGGIPATVSGSDPLAKGVTEPSQKLPNQTPTGGGSLWKNDKARTDEPDSFWTLPNGLPHLEIFTGRIGERIPSMTPVKAQTRTPEETHSRPYTNSDLLHPNGMVPTMDHSPHLSVQFPFRSAETSYQAIPVKQAPWPQPQPGIEQPATGMTNPAWYMPESLNSPPQDPEFDALLDGIVWDSHPT